jgi:hypothetical protein
LIKNGYWQTDFSRSVFFVLTGGCSFFGRISGYAEDGRKDQE